MKRYWAIVGETFVVPLIELPPEEMKRIKHDDRLTVITSVPVYFTKGDGVWPHPSNNCIVVQEVKEEEI